MASLISGMGQRLQQMFAGDSKVIRDPQTRDKREVSFQNYPSSEPIENRIKWLLDRFYYETMYEKILLHRKWFRNHLFFGGYHDLSLQDVGVSVDALTNAAEYAFPSNYYRAYIRYGTAMYIQTAPEFIAQPTSSDPISQGIAEAARAVLEIEKENIGYDAIRAMEAQNLRIYGNSFRYSYYSVDPRYGFTTLPVYEDVEQQISEGAWMCPQCGLSGDGNTDVCPQCGPDAQQKPINAPPEKAQVPTIKGQTSFPKGQECCEVVWPFEVYVRSSVKNLWQAPFLLRIRMVDKVALQSTFPKADFGGDTMADSTVEASEDLGLTYQQAVPNIPDDPTQYGTWYEQAVAPAKTALIEGWIRPSMYSFDKEMVKKFPTGLYGAKGGDTLLDSRDEPIDDHWTHFKHIHIEGRFWGDGDDDLIPEQMKLDEVDRLIMRHVDYNTLPLMLADAQRIDKNNIINDAGYIVELKNLGGKSIDQAVKWLPGGQLSTDVWNYRSMILNNMQFLSGVSPSAIGQHQPGVNTAGGQQQAVVQSNMTLGPLQLMYKEQNELWAVQMLKLAAKNWLDDRVQASMGVNGQWEFKQLRGELLKLDRVRVKARIIPLDMQQQQAFAQAIAAQVLNPQDPIVRRKAMELYQLPEGLDEFTSDAKVQTKEIEQFKQGQFPQPVFGKDNDQAHVRTLRDWMNSDEFDKQPPPVQQGSYGHLLAHFGNMQKMAAMQGAIEGAGAEAGGQAQQQQQPAPDKNANPAFRHNRGVKGQAAKPKLPQPPGGNQNHVGQPGMSHSAQQRRRNPK